MSDEEKTICKVIYLDEGSVSDYMQILFNGSMEKTIELLESSKEGNKHEGEIEAKVGIKGKLLEAIMGLKIEGAVGLNSEFSATQNQMVKLIIKSTILTDFIHLLEKIGKKDPEEAEVGDILKFHGYHLKTEENMLSQYVMDFFRQSIINPTREDSSVEKVNKKLKYAKGYFEFIGENSVNNQSIIMRFNIDCFRNGYTICDLQYMDLIICAIKVGKVNLDDLKRNSNFQNNREQNSSDRNIEKMYDMYDVLLAGIETMVNKEY